MSVRSYWYTSYFSQVLVAAPPYGGWKAAAGDTFKIMLMTPGYVPNQDTQAVKADVSGEVVGPGYVAGGKTLASKTISTVAGNLVVGAGAVAWGNCTFVTNRAVVYDDTNPLPASKQLMFWIDFGQIIDLNNQVITLTFDGLGNVTVEVTPPPDVTAPVLVNATVNANPLILSFSEPLNPQLVPAPGDFAVRVNAAPVVINAVAIVGANVTLTLAVAIVNGDIVTVAYTKPVLNHLEDLVGNDVASFTAQPVVNNTPPPIPPPDTTPPVLIEAICVGNQITLSYGESLNQSVVPAVGDYSVRVNSVVRPVSSVNVLGSNVVLLLSSPASQGQTVTLSYTPGVNKIQDVAGNFAAALVNTGVLNNSPDIIPPVLTSAEINGAQLTLTYDKPLDTGFTPATTAYDIKKNGVSQALNLVFVSTAKQVVIVLTNPVINTDVVIAAYTKPAVNYIRDLSGNAASSFLNFPVQNITAPAPPLVDDATFSGQTVPSLTMETSASQNVKVTMKNTGTTSWDSLGYQLRSQNPAGNTNWGLSTVPVPSPTPPAASSLFDFSITAPGTPGNYNFQWRMHKIGGADFGVASPNIVIAVNAVVSVKTWFVSTLGNDTTGNGTQGAPFKTIAKGIASMAGGDVLVIRGGSYPEIINSPPSGISNLLRTVVQAFSGETVITNGLDIYSRNYITVSHITLNGYSNHIGRSVSTNPASTFITLENVEARNWVGGGSGGGGFNIGFRQEGVSSNIRLTNCISHNNGSTNLDHGIYVSSRDNIIEGGSYYLNSGHGIQVYASAGAGSTNNTIIRGVVAHDNGSFGIGLYEGVNLLAYNNIAYHNGIIVSGAGGIRSAYNSSLAKILNNTVFGNTGYGIGLESSASDSTLENNISYQNTGSPISNSGNNPSLSNNLTTNPSFVDAVNHNFHLLAGSAAINAGLNLSLIFTTDFDGVSRPAVGAWEIGAYEFV